ncbi:UDP-glucose 4-epimerase GalE [Aestuariivita boseongensis]|uniref:UDP-glucose 4-epimerase GalE n=1 Tax=Aestuariivita boseongensis TaxID=1470562 RepID=UPI000680B918|nr:UDP-glucose 4-epimerase GalE [Aestuariivita boseongensis]
MSAQPVVVTGGAGFIGSHTCKLLRETGYQPITVDNLRTGHADAVKWGLFEKLDVRDTEGLVGLFEREQPVAVVHFAAAAYVGESVANPGLYYDNNVTGMTSLLAACARSGVSKVVFSSSCATYGIPETLPISEDTPQCPINPYGRTKLICEGMLSDFEIAHGIRSVALRYFNAAGADPSGELSERHDPETHLIPLALMAAAGTRPPLQVFGTDYPTPDGTCIRDYIHVSDLAAAHVAALRHLQAGKSSAAFNVGTGQGHSILEIAAAIKAVFGKDLPWNAAARRAGDPPTLVADTRRAAQELGFKATHSDLAQILRDAGPSFGLQAVDAVA